MAIQQSFNKKTKRFVKFKKTADGKTQILDNKQREPMKPFKGIPIKKNVPKKKR